MPDYILLNVKELSPQEQEIYKKFLAPRYWTALQGTDPWGVDSAVMYGVAAIENNIPIGLALATLRPLAHQAELLTLFVAESFRGQQVGTTLLKNLQRELKEAECQSVSYVYLRNDPCTTFLEALLTKLGWHPPELFIVKLYFHTFEFHPHWMDKKWLEKQCPLPEKYEISLWSEVKASEKERLQMRLDRGAFPYSVSPFYESITMEPSNSLVLYNDQTIIGWMITNRLAQDTVQYSSFYVEPAYQFAGYSVPLLAESIYRQQQALIPESIVELNMRQISHSWIRFVKKRLIPLTYKVDRLNRRVCLL